MHIKTLKFLLRCKNAMTVMNSFVGPAVNICTQSCEYQMNESLYKILNFT